QGDIAFIHSGLPKGRKRAHSRNRSRGLYRTAQNGMIGKRNMLHGARLALGHVAAGAIVAGAAACLLLFLACGSLVALLAAAAIVGGAIRRRRLLVWVVATSAPEAVSARPFAGALLELFIMARGRQLGLAGVRPDEHRQIIGE